MTDTMIFDAVHRIHELVSATVQTERPGTTATMAVHKSALIKAVVDLDLTPDQLRWHYIHLTHASCAGNVSLTARTLGMHRRSLQRILSKRAPQRNTRVSVS